MSTSEKRKSWCTKCVFYTPDKELTDIHIFKVGYCEICCSIVAQIHIKDCTAYRKQKPDVVGYFNNFY